MQFSYLDMFCVINDLRYLIIFILHVQWSELF